MGIDAQAPAETAADDAERALRHRLGPLLQHRIVGIDGKREFRIGKRIFVAEIDLGLVRQRH